MATATQTRCAGCGRFVTRRADVFDAEYDDYAAGEREYHAETEEHECSMDYYGANLGPRDGEYDAYLASLETELSDDAELVEAAQEFEAAAEVTAEPVALVETVTTTEPGEGDHDGESDPRGAARTVGGGRRGPRVPCRGPRQPGRRRPGAGRGWCAAQADSGSGRGVALAVRQDRWRARRPA
jgi:hypothetical protein